MTEPPPQSEVIDTITATLIEFESGPLSHLGANFVSAPLFTLDLHGTEANAFFRVEQDAFPWGRSDLLDAHSVFQLQKRGSAEQETIPIAGEDVLREELDELARFFREGGAPDIGGREGLVALGVVLASLEAAHLGQAVDFPRFIHSTV